MRTFSSSTKPKAARRLQIFLCHASGDKAAVRKLHRRLQSLGFDTWLDEEKLLPGQDWRQEIPRAVRTSDVVLVCLSQSATTKEGYVQKEIRFALDVAEEKPDGTIFIIPVKLEECIVPERLANWHWVNLFEKSGYDKLIKSLRLRANTLGVSDVASDAAITESPPQESTVIASAGDVANTESVGANPPLLIKAVDEANIPSGEPQPLNSWRNWGDHPLVVGISVLAAIVAVIVFITGRDNLISLFSQSLEPVATSTAVSGRAATATFAATQASQGTESTTATIQSILATNIPTTLVSSTDTIINTPAPSATAEPTITATATPPGLSVLSDRLNLRSGPGTSYNIVGTYSKNTILEGVGRNSDSSWLKVGLPDNNSGWMSVSGLSININIKELPIVEAPPLPTDKPTIPTVKPSPTSSSSELDGIYTGTIGASLPMELQIKNGRVYINLITYRTNDSNCPEAGIEVRNLGSTPIFGAGTTGQYGIFKFIANPYDVRGSLNFPPEIGGTVIVNSTESSCTGNMTMPFQVTKQP